MKRILAFAACLALLSGCCSLIPRARPVHCWPAVGHHRPTCPPPLQWTGLGGRRA